MRFAKAHSLGNDFLFVEERDVTALSPRGVGVGPHAKNPKDNTQIGPLARAICDRNRGVGADGLVVFRAERNRPFAMRIFNQDGSEAEMSGNGLRCLGAVLRFWGRATIDPVVVQTAAGERELELVSHDGPRFVFRAKMGVPDNVSVSEPLEIDGRTYLVTTLSVGNPHAVLLFDAWDLDLLRTLGPRIERHSRFPDRTNVELVRVVTRNQIAVGFWERGVGETGASGTGASAAAVAAILNGKVDEHVTVLCPGGALDVSWPGRRDVLVTGEAVVVANGEFI